MSCRVLAPVLFAILTSCSSSPEKLVAEGRKYFDQGRLTEAELQYKKAIQRDPSYGEAYYRLALLDLKRTNGARALANLRRAVELLPVSHVDSRKTLGDFALAIALKDPRHPLSLVETVRKCAKDLLSQNPGQSDGLRYNAYLALLERHLPEAIELFQKADQAKPGQAEVRLVLGQLLIETERAEEGEKVIEELIRQQPQIAEAWQFLASRYVSTSRVSQAESLLRQIAQRTPRDPQIPLSLAALYAATNRKGEAEDVLAGLRQQPDRYDKALLMLGDFYVANLRFDAALEVFRQCTGNLLADAADCRKRSIGTLALLGRRQEAQAQLAESMKVAPDDPQLLRAKAFLDFDEGDPAKLDGIIATLEEQLQSHPADSLLHYRLGLAKQRKGVLNEAVRHYQAAAQLNITDRRPRIELANILLQQGQLDQALLVAEDALKIAPGNPEAALLRARTLERLLRVAEARTALVDLARSQPNNTLVQTELARFHLRQRRFAEAESVLRPVYTPGAQDIQVLLTLVQALSAQGKAPQAMQLVQKDLASAPNRPAVELILAEGYLNHNDEKSALTHLQQIAVYAPNYAPAWLLMGQLHARADRLPQSLDCLEKARSLAPASPDVLLALATVQRAAGNQKRAQETLQSLLAKNPSASLAILALGDLLPPTDPQFEQLRARTADLQRTQPAAPDLSDALAFLHLRAGKPGEALALLQPALAQEPENPLYLYHFGLAQKAAGNTAEARRVWQKALLAESLRPTLGEQIRKALASAS